MNFLHLLNLDTVGGVEELFCHFLQTSDYNNHVLITGKKPHPFFSAALNAAISIHTEKYAGPLKLPRWLRAYRSNRYIEHIQPKLVVLWNRFEPISFRPVIYYEHGASWMEKKERKTNFFSAIRGCIANSFAAKRVLQLKWNCSIPITVIDNPIRPDIIPANQPKRLSTHTCDVHLGYIGRLINLKGVCLALHAVQCLNDSGIRAQLSIAGDGTMRPFLEKECERLNITPSVHFLGNISAVQPFYDSIDILLVPSIREPLGLVAQEAACRGCPVIATAVDGLCEVVQNEKTGFTIQAGLSMKQYSTYSKHNEGIPDCVYDPLTDTLSEPKAIAPEMIAQKVALLLEPSVYELFSKQAIAFAAQRPNFDLYQKNLTALLQEFLV